ncbi:MAG: hypothetical protein RJA90_725 [Bacteroidota bacterium]|jgi:hypothetical protein
MMPIFVTGWTFDKEFTELNRAYFLKDTHVPDTLEKGCNISPIKGARVHKATEMSPFSLSVSEFSFASFLN